MCSHVDSKSEHISAGCDGLVPVVRDIMRNLQSNTFCWQMRWETWTSEDASCQSTSIYTSRVQPFDFLIMCLHTSGGAFYLHTSTMEDNSWTGSEGSDKAVCEGGGGVHLNASAQTYWLKHTMKDSITLRVRSWLTSTSQHFNQPLTSKGLKQGGSVFSAAPLLALGGGAGSCNETGL